MKAQFRRKNLPNDLYQTYYIVVCIPENSMPDGGAQGSQNSRYILVKYWFGNRAGQAKDNTCTVRLPKAVRPSRRNKMPLFSALRYMDGRK